MKIMVIAFGIILLFLAIPVQSQTLTDAQKAEIEKVVKNQITKLFAAWDSMNAEAYVQLWSRDKIMGELRPTGLESSFETMLKTQKTNFARETAHKNEILDIKVHVISPEMALAFSKSTVRIELKNGNINN